MNQSFIHQKSAHAHAHVHTYKHATDKCEPNYKRNVQIKSKGREGLLLSVRDRQRTKSSTFYLLWEMAYSPCALALQTTNFLGQRTLTTTRANFDRRSYKISIEKKYSSDHMYICVYRHTHTHMRACCIRESQDNSYLA